MFTGRVIELTIGHSCGEENLTKGSFTYIATVAKN